MKTIKIERLAELMSYTLWSKGDMKRIYLNDVGYNTKKMSTKAFIFEKHGQFLVSCRIECPSQDINWIKSQEEEVMESIYSKIEDVVSMEVSDKIYVIAKNDKFINFCEKEVSIGELKDDEYEFYSEKKANEALCEISEDEAKIVAYDREEYLKIQCECIKNHPKEKMVDNTSTYLENKPSVINVNKEAKKPKDIKVEMYGVGTKCKHINFGIGEIIEETDSKVKILFPNAGEKELLKRFAKLEKV